MNEPKTFASGRHGAGFVPFSGDLLTINTTEKITTVHVHRDKLTAKYIGKGAHTHDVGISFSSSLPSSFSSFLFLFSRCVRVPLFVLDHRARTS